MKRRISCFFLTSCMVLSLLTGCSKEQETELVGQASELSSYKDVKVGVCIYQLTDNFMSRFNNELVDYLISKGFSKENIIVLSSFNSDIVQVSQVEGLIEQGVDGLIVNPVNSSIVQTITDMAMENNIPVVYVNREPSGDEENRWETLDLKAAYVGGDARQSGIYQGELLLSLGEKKLDVNHDGKIQYYMIEGAPENIDAGYRTKYSVATLKNAGIEMECLVDAVGNWNMDIAYDIVHDGFDQDLIPEVIICNNDAMALGAIKAVEQAALEPGKDVFVVGVDGLPEAIELIQRGKLVGTVYNDYIIQSHRAANTMINYMRGAINEHYISCDYIKVNKDNAQAMLDKITADSAFSSSVETADE